MNRLIIVCLVTASILCTDIVYSAPVNLVRNRNAATNFHAVTNSRAGIKSLKATKSTNASRYRSLDRREFAPGGAGGGARPIVDPMSRPTR